MILTDYFYSSPSIQWDYARQAGISHATMRLPDVPDFDFTDRSAWEEIYGRFTSFGVKPVVIEPVPNQLHDHIKAGDENRDECIETFIKMLAIMDRLGIRTVCVNFMAHIGWFRTRHDLPARGGALVSGFCHADCPDEEPLRITGEKLWDNLNCFLQAVMPYAERHGIRIALHPDDPPVARMKDVSRILISRTALEKAVSLYKSDYLGYALCQGSYGAMGEDIESLIRGFSVQDKLFFVHFRDVSGTKENFRETFHDNGPTDMAKIIRIYQECGYAGPIRVDHVPTMAGEDNSMPGYAAVGRLFAIGYLKGLLDAAGYFYS